MARAAERWAAVGPCCRGKYGRAGGVCQGCAGFAPVRGGAGHFAEGDIVAHAEQPHDKAAATRGGVALIGGGPHLQGDAGPVISVLIITAVLGGGDEFPAQLPGSLPVVLQGVKRAPPR